MCLIGDRKQDWLYFLTKSKGDQEIGNDKAKLELVLEKLFQNNLTVVSFLRELHLKWPICVYEQLTVEKGLPGSTHYNII